MDHEKLMASVQTTILRIGTDIKRKKGNVGSEKINAYSKLVNSYNRLIERVNQSKPAEAEPGEGYYEKMIRGEHYPS